MGRLALSLGAIDVSQTPLERRVDELGRQIARVVGAICVALVLFGVAVDGFGRLLSIVMFGVAFGVAIVPEGMPAMMTLSLALGVQRMARRQAVVRRLAAVEALGLGDRDRQRQDRHAHPKSPFGDRATAPRHSSKARRSRPWSWPTTQTPHRALGIPWSWR